MGKIVVTEFISTMTDPVGFADVTEIGADGVSIQRFTPA